MILRQLYGFEGDFPRESTSSSVFLEFSEESLAAKVHDVLVGEIVANRMVDDISQDSTAMEFRAKVAREVVNIKKGISFHEFCVHFIALVELSCQTRSKRSRAFSKLHGH
ncbi:MAG: hypothetical protein WCI18_11810 [Pseudomonadota bacterium]